MKNLINCFFFSVFFVSCGQVNPPTRQIVDLRIKDINGNIVRSSTRTTEIGSEIEITKISYGENENFGNFTIDDIKQLVKFYNDENGVRIRFFRPTFFGNEKIRFYPEVIYVTATGAYSTSMHMADDNYLNNYVEGDKSYFTYDMKDESDVVFPFVMKNKPQRLVIQYYFFGELYQNSTIFQVEYSFTPQCGLGIGPGPLPNPWNSTDYTNLEGRIFSVHDVIPVEASEVRKSVSVFVTNDPKNHWAPDNTYMCGYKEEISDYTEDAFYTELPEGIFLPYKYFYVLFCYEYSLEGYDYCKFNTVGFESDIIESDKLYANN